MRMYFLLSLFIGLFIFAMIWYFWPETKLDTTKNIDKVLVIKHQKLLQLFSEGTLLKSYPISLGKQAIGKKEFEGDQKTPEGKYIINSKNANSSFYLNLGISYPNEADIAHAKAMGKSPGGLIKIHGIRNGMGYIGKFHRFRDWTAGCIAVTNKEMDELYHAIAIGTEIEIVP